MKNLRVRIIPSKTLMNTVSNGNQYIGYPVLLLMKLNKKIRITSQFKYSFCELHDEILQHLFYECAYAQNLWKELRLYLSEKVTLPI